MAGGLGNRRSIQLSYGARHLRRAEPPKSDQLAHTLPTPQPACEGGSTLPAGRRQPNGRSASEALLRHAAATEDERPSADVVRIRAQLVQGGAR